jgi:hypothetical protein
MASFSISQMNDEVRLLGLGLETDETLPNTVCPVCGGGHDKEKSFSVTRIDSGYVYNCFRATCHVSGFTPEKSHAPNPRTTTKSMGGTSKPEKIGGKAAKRNPFHFSTLNPTAEQTQFLVDKFHFTEDEWRDVGIRYCAETQSYIVPIYNIHGFKVGNIDRSYNGRNPKTINHWNVVERTNLYWPRHQESVDKPLVVVEDFASAIKVGRFRQSVAILGSHFGDKEAQEMRSVSDILVIALDPDANAQAFKLRDKYKLLFNKVIVMALDKDPKDMNNRELEKTFGDRLNFIDD